MGPPPVSGGMKAAIGAAAVVATLELLAVGLVVGLLIFGLVKLVRE